MVDPMHFAWERWLESFRQGKKPAMTAELAEWIDEQLHERYGVAAKRNFATRFNDAHRIVPLIKAINRLKPIIRRKFTADDFDSVYAVAAQAFNLQTNQVRHRYRVVMNIYRDMSLNLDEVEIDQDDPWFDRLMAICGYIVSERTWIIPEEGDEIWEKLGMPGGRMPREDQEGKYSDLYDLLMSSPYE